MEITVTRVPHNGHLNLSTIHNKQFVQQTYVGVNQREAKRLFRQHIKAIK